MRLWVFFLLAVGGLTQSRPLPAISEDALRRDVSFLASDELEGRDTPSHGLDMAAQYIAAQFRRAGLQPAGDGYFQTAKMLRITPTPAGIQMRLQRGARAVTVAGDKIAVVATQPLKLSLAPLSRIAKGAALPSSLKGSVVEVAGVAPVHLAPLNPVAFLELAGESDAALPHLIEAASDIPRIILRDAEASKFLHAGKAGDAGVTISITVPAATATAVTVCNVAGLLRGSDPVLSKQYVLLTAHYDHLGRDGTGQVFPGANDDGSGTASVIEIAQALAAAPAHPKRSILFMTFFGEEEGNLGSHYYTAHPLYPLAKTVADLNLEQLGRTDSNTGPELSNATLTGFDYSSVSQTLQRAGEQTGVKVYATPNGDDYFDRSDNQTFAERGIPAHTVAVALEFPDYHTVRDTWQKIDYSNLAKVDRMIALATELLADSAAAPQWNRANPKVERYLPVPAHH